MSDDMGDPGMPTKKPTLSEIRAREQVNRDAHFSCNVRTDIPYLLELVSRMGKALEHKFWCCNHVLSHSAACEFCQEARVVLEELKK